MTNKKENANTVNESLKNQRDVNDENNKGDFNRQDGINPNQGHEVDKRQ